MLSTTIGYIRITYIIIYVYINVQYKSISIEGEG